MIPLRYFFFALFLSIAQLPNAVGQTASPIQIGAQVYIEPGQTKEDIHGWFETLNGHNMTVCRIRMDEAHMRQPDGSFDFSLYDIAFDAAEKNGVDVFATLFPLNTAKDVGGFKFPNTEQHLEDIARYIQLLVEHFKDHPALKAWVLQNEPGVGGIIPENDFTEMKWEEWTAKEEATPLYNGFMRVEFLRERFLRDYTTWFLGWIADEVKKNDDRHEFHVNNHMIFNHLPEYDFPEWRKFLSHLGASMHPSWHFGYFDRLEYPLAMSANCEIIRTGAGDLPFWVTELQGGNNNFSGFQPLMPTEEEIAQWLWTCIGSGARGIIFWTLNPRAVGFEAGEWAMVDFQGQPTDRLQMAGKVAKMLEEEPNISQATPLLANIHVLYSNASMVFQADSEMSSPMAADIEARKQGGHIKAAIGHYQALLGQGVAARFGSFEDFDWEMNPEGQTVLLPNMAIVPRKFYQPIKNFVEKGGKLVVTGQTAHFDEYYFNVMYGGDWPLKELMGGQIREFRANGTGGSVQESKQSIPYHFLKGIIKPEGAEVLERDGKGHAVASKHAFVKGEVFWAPSIVGLADPAKVAEWMRPHLSQEISTFPVRLSSYHPLVTLRTLEIDGVFYSILVNKNFSSNQEVTFVHEKPLSSSVIFSLKGSPLKNERVTLLPDECMVIKWE